MRRQYHEHRFLWTQQPWPIATGDHRSGSHSSVDPAGSGHPLASPGPTGPTGPATHHRQGQMVDRQGVVE
jgi:hypothetical protein